MQVLVVNCGSSSLKCRLFDMAEECELAAGSVERLGDSGSRLRATAGDAETERETTARTHDAALAELADALFALAGSDASTLGAVGHRVVHGGERFRAPALVDDATETAIEALTPLAPLHNPLGLLGIRTARGLYPEVPHVAVFDTAFHADLPPHAYLYALPWDLYERHRVRRYGFHGSSHAYAAERAVALLGLGAEHRVVTCHLGAGCSTAAVRDGRSVDTSMGMTPLEGLPMATRSGDVDPGILVWLGRERGLGAAEIDDLLNRESGLLGVSGRTGDIRELESAAAGGNERAELALSILAYRVRKAIGASLAALGGADAVAFTGGAGAGSAALRTRSVEALDGLGLRLDAGANTACAGNEAVISTHDSATALVVVPSNEELLIARATAAACSGGLEAPRR